VATQVGYSSPFALSTAFKRVRGISPKEHRRITLTEVGPTGAQAEPLTLAR
jgi:AraC-like DNA-binding protein